MLGGREEISVHDELGGHVAVLLLQKQKALSDLNRGKAEIDSVAQQLCWETDANKPADSISLTVGTLLVLREPT